MLNTSVTQIASIIATTQNLGQKVPAELVKAHDRSKNIVDRSSRIYASDKDLNAAMLTALDNDRDPAADPDVQRIVLSQAIGNEHRLQGIRSAVTDDLLQALATNANALVKLWQKPFDEAAHTIARTARILGPIKLEDAAAILEKGGNAAQLWTEAKQADGVIDSIMSAWTSLAIETQFAPNDRRLKMLRLTDPTLDQWESLDLIEQRLGAWDAHALGLTLSLADGPEFSARWSRIDSERRSREQSNRDQNNGKLSQSDRKQMAANFR